MAKNTASVDELASLHKTIADALIRACSITEVTETAIGPEGEPVEVTKDYIPPASTLSVAVRFLKDNAITAEAEGNEKLEALEDLLTKRKADRGKASVSEIPVPVTIDDLLEE